MISESIDQLRAILNDPANSQATRQRIVEAVQELTRALEIVQTTWTASFPACLDGLSVEQRKAVLEMIETTVVHVKRDYAARLAVETARLAQAAGDSGPAVN